MLSTTTVDVIQVTKTKSVKGGFTNSEASLYTAQKARIEIQEVQNPVKVGGRQLTRWYLIHLWGATGVDLNSVQDGYFIDDNTSDKRYEIIDILPGFIHKQGLYKLEIKAIVLSDDRFTDSDKHL